MDQIGLLLRVGVSLAVVVGLMWLAARALRGVAGRGGGVLEVVARQQIGRGSAVAVVRVANKGLVLGVTDNYVTLLGETDLLAVEASRDLSRRTALPAGDGADPQRRILLPSAAPAAAGSPFDGSILSPQTWRRTVHTLRERTVRK